MPLIEHQVVFSPSKGIFLGILDGNVRWSKDHGVKASEKAPVFDGKMELEKYIYSFLSEEQQKAWPDDIMLVVVHPYDTNPLAVDREVVANAGLPVWGEESSKVLSR